MRLSSPLTVSSIWWEFRKFRLAAGILVALLSFGLNLGVHGTVALDWQHLYRPEDFTSWADLWEFLRNLQTGISPFWATLEIACQLIFGSTWLVTALFYPAVIALNGYWATTLFTQKRWQVALIAGLYLVFAVGIRFIHKGNPQIYDATMPALILGWLAALMRVRTAPQGKGLRWALLAGLALTVLELTRTLIFPLMPFFLVLSFLALRPQPIRHFLVLLLPIVLLSGSWHLKQVICHDQVHWSNHDGFNMQKSWAHLTGPVPTDFVDDPPRYAGGMDDINTDKHTAYNKVVRKQVRAAILAHPREAAAHLSQQFIAFYSPKTTLFLGVMPSWWAALYRPAVWLCAALMLWRLARMGLRTLQAPLRKTSWLAWGQPLVALSLITLLISCVFAVGEVGEEARFMISLLPLLAAGATNQLQ